MKAERFFKVVSRVNAIVLLLVGLIILGLMVDLGLEELGIGENRKPVIGCQDCGGISREIVDTSQPSHMIFGNFESIPGSEWAKADILVSTELVRHESSYLDYYTGNFLFFNSDTGESRTLLPENAGGNMLVVSDHLKEYGWDGGPYPLLLYIMHSGDEGEGKAQVHKDPWWLAVSRLDGSGFKTIVSSQGKLKLIRENDAGNVVLYYIIRREMIMVEVDPVSLEIQKHYKINVGQFVSDSS